MKRENISLLRELDITPQISADTVALPADAFERILDLTRLARSKSAERHALLTEIAALMNPGRTLEAMNLHRSDERLVDEAARVAIDMYTRKRTLQVRSALQNAGYNASIIKEDAAVYELRA